MARFAIQNFWAPTPARHPAPSSSSSASVAVAAPPGAAVPPQTAPPMRALVPSNVIKRPSRPGYGTAGKNQWVTANNFRVELRNNMQIYHYEVAITPEVISAGVNRAILKQLVQVHGQSELGHRVIAYDGRKNAYTTATLPFEYKDFVVDLAKKDGKAVRRERKFTVTIRLAAKVDMHPLQQFLEGSNSDAPHEVIHILDVVLRETPSARHATVGRSLFLHDESGDGSLGDYQSLPPTQMGPSLNVDLSTTAFYEPKRVSDFVSEVLVRKGSTRSLTDAERAKMKKLMRGIKMKTVHQVGKSREYRIPGISSLPEKQLMFEDKNFVPMYADGDGAGRRGGRGRGGGGGGGRGGRGQQYPATGGQGPPPRQAYPSGPVPQGPPRAHLSSVPTTCAAPQSTASTSSLTSRMGSLAIQDPRTPAPARHPASSSSSASAAAAAVPPQLPPIRLPVSSKVLKPPSRPCYGTTDKQYCDVTANTRVTKPRIRDIIVSTSPRIDREQSPRAWPPAKQKPKPSNPLALTTCNSNSNNNNCVYSNKPGVSPRLARPPLQSKAIPKNRGGISTSSCPSSMPKDANRTLPTPPAKKQPTQRKEPGCTAPGITRLKPLEQKSYPLPEPVSTPTTNSTSVQAKAISIQRIEFPRHLEKGESSQSSKSSLGGYSSSTSISGDSNQSGSAVIGSRPHMSNNVRWASIRSAEVRNGGIGLTNFKLLKRLGCGNIGTVYLAELCGTGCLFALKVMDNEFLARRKKMMRALTEREILQMLDHPFLPTLYTHFTTDNLSCLVMEYCPGGDLHVLRHKQQGRHFSEASTRFYAAEILLALEYLHMLGVVYRDLKPENILVREDGHIMLSDFDLSLRCSVNPFLARASSVTAADCARPSGACSGSGCIDPLCLHSSWAHSSCFTPRLLSSATPMTRKLKADQTTHGRSLPQLVVEPTEARSNSFVGTHEYLAPEIIRGEGHGSSVDWWTFGIFLYELLYGKTPFKGCGNEETLANVISQNLRFPDSPAVSFRARDLIRGLLVKEPENRLGSRKGAAEIKRHPFFEGLNWALIRCATPLEMPKRCDYGSIVAEVLSKKEETAMEFKENGNIIEFELF